MIEKTNREKWLLSKTMYLTLSCSIVIFIYWFTQPADRLSSQPAPTDGICEVIHVYDGDTITVSCQGSHYKIRLLHIDTPEIDQDHWGIAAKQALSALVKNRVKVFFHGKDIYNRELAILHHSLLNDRSSVNLTMLEQGFARVYATYNPPANYLTAMQKAKQQQIGIWSETGLQQNPQRYRRLK